MRTKILAIVFASALLLGGAVPIFGGGTASADVHPVSQANCASPGASSGATQQASRDAPGRPDAPIPVTASDGKTQGKAGAAPAQGANC